MKRQYLNLGLAAVTAFSLSGCGNQTFDAVQQAQSTGPAGSVTIAPKVDILIAVDDTGSTCGQIQANLQTALSYFLSNVQSQGWDIRIAAMPLTNPNFTLTKIAASSQDYNWNAFGGWTPPYPGAPIGSTIPASMFQKPSQLSVSFSCNGNAGNGGVENGITNINRIVNSAAVKNIMARPDALFVTAVFTNGEDTSDGVTIDGFGMSHPNLPSGPSETLRFNHEAFKDPSLASTIKFVSVSAKSATACLGGSATVSRRYPNFASRVGGGFVNATSLTPGSYDICPGAFTSVLSDIASDLSKVTLDFKKTHAFLNFPPRRSSIKIYKTFADGHRELLPENMMNGWEYLGYQTNLPEITYPIDMQFNSGYAFRLHGTAALVGNMERLEIQATDDRIN